MAALALDAVFSFSPKPIRIATRVGLVTVLVGLCYLTYILCRAVFLGDLVQGWGSIVSVLLILNGGQIVFVGLVGEYLSRVFEEIKSRPRYILKQPLQQQRCSGAQTDSERSDARDPF